MSEESRAKVVSGEAWNEFCDALKAAGELILKTMPDQVKIGSDNPDSA